jgi:hypothetical protein
MVFYAMKTAAGEQLAIYVPCLAYYSNNPILSMSLGHSQLSLFWHLRLWLVFLYAVISTSEEAEARSPTIWNWQRNEGKSLALFQEDTIIWRLNYGPDLAKPYFDPLTLPGGGNLTWIAPPDHVWHYGVWFSWKYINGINYWENNNKTGKPDGTMRLLHAKVLRTDATGADIQFDFDFHPAAGGDPVMKETVRLSIETPRPNGSYTIDWHQTSTAPDNAEIILDRTPPPDQPGSKPYGGYGGFSFRGAKDLTNATVLDSEGRRNMDAHRGRARWLDTSGTILGQPAGVTFFDHPANPGHPTRWYVALRPLKDGPFTYMNPAILHDAPITLGRGESISLRYRILVHPGPADPPALDAEFNRFSRSDGSDPRKP